MANLRKILHYTHVESNRSKCVPDLPVDVHAGGIGTAGWNISCHLAASPHQQPIRHVEWIACHRQRREKESDGSR